MTDEIQPDERAGTEGEVPSGGPVELPLPKKFLADDPGFVDRSVSGRSERKVLIPDGKGGLKSVDQQVVRIQHRGETVELVAMSEEDRLKRQRLINVLAILFGIVFLLLFFWLLFT